MKLKSLQLKIAVWAGACLVAAAAIFITYSAYTTRSLVVEDAKQQAVAEARNQAAQVQTELEAALNVSRALSQSVKAAKVSQEGSTISRAEINAMLRQVLVDNPTFLAIYSSWEPDAFDGQDKTFAGKPGYNNTGRFNTTFSRNDAGGIEIDSTSDNEEDSQDWYQLPKKNLGDTILDPYLYPVQGVDTLETSLISPIIIDNKFLGLVGIDIRIDSLQQKADKLALYEGTGQIIIISNNGTIAAATRQPSWVNQPLTKVLPDLAGHSALSNRNATGLDFVGNSLVVIQPFTVGATKTPWAIALVVPQSKIYLPAHRQLGVQVLLGIAMVALALAAIWLLSGRITAPLREAAKAAQSLSFGVLPEKPLEVKTVDETGQLLSAMNQMTAYLKDMAHAADQLSSGDLSANVAPLSREDAFGNAFLGLTRYLDRMAQVSDHIAQGDLSVSVQPLSEKDRFGLAFRNMLERTLVLVQSQTERDEIQRSIMKLLDEVADVATGDLTAEAEVTSDMTGAIADAFNMMLAELRQLIHRVKDTTGAVNRSANYIQLATDELAAGSEFQAQQIAHTTNAVEMMAASIQEVSARAATAAQVTQNALARAQQGAHAVENNMAAMTRIRDQAQETAKRIKRLGERSQEIGHSVQLIQDIADRTSMLALNAAIQAANAGAEGRGFVVVAEEIESLAERATVATQQIETQIQNIQGETTEVVAAMEEMTGKIVQGSSLTSETGAALQEIEGVAQKLAVLSAAIAQASQQQTHSSHAVAQAMSDISRVTFQMERGTNQVAGSARQLVTQAEALRGSVVAFRLPEPVAPDLMPNLEFLPPDAQAQEHWAMS